MKRFILLLALGLAAAVPPLHSQTAAKESALVRLQALKAQNDKLLEQQAAAQQKLEEIKKESQQLRALARRT